MVLGLEAWLLAASLALPVCAVDTRSSESGRPRGVGPEFAKFYKTPTTFSCISNPSINIPISRINDDFCDCPDGSDEPGTAACAYLSPLSPPQPAPGIHADSITTRNTTLVLPGFYCKNKGHIPAYIKFESVNDGRCDYDTCCDGSDEYAGVGGVSCPDRCAEIGKEYRRREEARNQSLQAALKCRKDLLQQANTIKKELEMRIHDFENKIAAKEVKVKAAQESLKDVERREQLRMVRGDAAGRGTGKTGVLLGLAKGRVEELRNALEQTKRHRDQMLDRVGELEGLLATLKEERNPNFNDEGVKRAVRGWEDYAARETDDHWTEAQDRDLEAILQADGEQSGVNWAEFAGSEEEESDVAALYSFTNYLPPALQVWLDEKVASVRQLLVDNGILAAPGTNANVAESKAVQDAKRVVEEAQRDLDNLQKDLTAAKDDLGKDYGPDSIFRALKDKCISHDSGEYTYELCFLGQTKQKSKKGGADTNMGNFVGYDIEMVDDELPADGKGLGRGERIVMKHENGQHCWNGPNRSTKVVMACSENEEIWKVSESEKCVYRMEIGTAAVCGFRDTAKTNGPGQVNKDEL